MSLKISSIVKALKKLGYLHIAGGNMKWYSHYKTAWQFRKALEIKFPYDSMIPPLDTYLQ